MYFLIEASIALSVSFFINLFVVAVFGQAFYQQTNEAAVRPTSPHSHSCPPRTSPHALQALWEPPGSTSKPFDVCPADLALVGEGVRDLASG